MSRAAAISALLADPDPAVQTTLRHRLLADDALFAEVWAAAAAAGEVRPATLTAVAIERECRDLAGQFAGAIALEDGMWALERLARPLEADPTREARALDQLASDCAAASDPADLARRLHEDWGFSGDRLAYHHPDNALLGPCLARRAGLPLTLTILWMGLCRRLGWRVAAAPLPGHVIGSWSGGWFDCFSGRAIDRDEIAQLCLRSGVVDPRPYLEPASDRALLLRATRNLAYAWRVHGDRERASAARSLVSVLDRRP